MVKGMTGLERFDCFGLLEGLAQRLPRVDDVDEVGFLVFGYERASRL